MTGIFLQCMLLIVKLWEIMMLFLKELSGITGIYQYAWLEIICAEG